MCVTGVQTCALPIWAGFKEKRIAPKTKKPYFADVSCGLKAVAERRLELEMSKEEQTSDWSTEVLTTSQLEYAAKDVKVLPLIAKQQYEELKEENLLGIYSIESKCIRPVAQMSRLWPALGKGLRSGLRYRTRTAQPDSMLFFRFFGLLVTQSHMR